MVSRCACKTSSKVSSEAVAKLTDCDGEGRDGGSEDGVLDEIGPSGSGQRGRLALVAVIVAGALESRSKAHAVSDDGVPRAGFGEGWRDFPYPAMAAVLLLLLLLAESDRLRVYRGCCWGWG